MTPSAKNVPEYLTENFIAAALNEGFQRNDVKIDSMSTKLTSEGGENYCSDIYQVKVRYSTTAKENQGISLIVKDMKKNYKNVLPLESKEKHMYNIVVPKLQEILGDGIQLAPKCFTATDEFDEIFIFEDLNALGYTLGDRLLGLDEGHAHAVLEKIGIFHAASMVLAEKHPELIAKVGRSFFAEGIAKIPLMCNMINSSLDTVAELLSTWNGFEEIVTKVKNFRSKYDEKLIEAQDSDKIRFKVLNHGDLWVNNIFFKNENNTCVDVKLIDLQVTTYASPGYDLHYFFTTSVPLDIVVTKRYDFLRTYHTSLKDTLARLEYSAIPTWDDVLNEMRVTKFFALQSVLLTLPLICLEKESSKGNDLNTLKDQNTMKLKRIQMYKSKRLLASTRFILDEANDSGLLD